MEYLSLKTCTCFHIKNIWMFQMKYDQNHCILKSKRLLSTWHTRYNKLIKFFSGPAVYFYVWNTYSYANMDVWYYSCLRPRHNQPGRCLQYDQWSIHFTYKRHVRLPLDSCSFTSPCNQRAPKAKRRVSWRCPGRWDRFNPEWIRI